MNVRQSSQHFAQLKQGSTRRNRHPKHLAEHGNADLKANSSKKAGEHGLREKVGDKAHLEQARHQQKRSRQQCDRAREGHIAGAGGGRHVREFGSKDRRGGGVCGNHQIAGRSEGGKGHRRQQQRVKTSHHGHAGDPGVSQGLRDVHGRQGDSGKAVAQGRRELEWARRLKKLQQSRISKSGVYIVGLEDCSLL